MFDMQPDSQTDYGSDNENVGAIRPANQPFVDALDTGTPLKRKRFDEVIVS